MGVDRNQDVATKRLDQVADALTQLNDTVFGLSTPRGREPSPPRPATERREPLLPPPKWCAGFCFRTKRSALAATTYMPECGTHGERAACAMCAGQLQITFVLACIGKKLQR